MYIRQKMRRFLKKRIVFYLDKIDVIRRRKSFAANLLLSNAATNHRVHVRECVHCDIELSWRAGNTRGLVYMCTDNEAEFSHE